MASVQEITSEEQYNEIAKSATASTLLVLYFKASWAAPCAQVSTILETLAGTYPSDSSVQFLAIDAEELPDISESFDVASVPFIVLQKDGKVVDTVSGVDAVKLRSSVEKHAASKPGTEKSGLPPALTATRPAGQENGAGSAMPESSETKNLAKYAPGAGDPATGPEYSSNEMSESSKDELNQRLASLVKAAPVMLFMKGTPSAPQCGFSRQLVSMLRENGVKYGFFNILADDEVRQGLKEYSDWPTFPQLYAKGELVGGLDIVKEELESDPDFFKEFSVKSTTGGPGITA